MTRTSLAIVILGLATGVAHAQMPGAQADRAETAHAVSGPDGTVGAMQAVVQGLATSADDVVAQQDGRGTAAAGARVLDGRLATTAAGSAPGTVGAAPGNDAAR